MRNNAQSSDDVPAIPIGPKLISSLAVDIGTLGLALVAIALASSAVVKAVGKPVDIEIGKYFKGNEYRRRVSFVEQIHGDFDKIVNTIVGRERVFIFIDDLDRCESSQATKLMKAFNLLISNRSRIIFLLGIDREKIAAGFAVEHGEMLPYLSDTTSPSGDNGHPANRSAALEFGHRFIEKFIQIPFRVPRMSREHLAGFVDAIVSTSSDKQSTPRKAHESLAPEGDSLVEVTTSAGQSAGQEENTQQGMHVNDDGRSSKRVVVRQIETKFGADSPGLREMVIEMAPYFGHNPRRVKQFINLFRLHVFIVHGKGMLAELGSDGGPGYITFQQMGKFVAISLLYPSLVSDLERYPRLLQQLELVAVGKEPPIIGRWAQREDLLELLRCGSWKKIKGIEMRYSFAEPPLDIEPLIAVSVGRSR